MEGYKRRGRKRRHDEEITHKLDLLQEPPDSFKISGGRWTYHNPVDLNPNTTDIRITIPRWDDEFTDLFGAILIITLSVISTAGADLGANIDNVTVHQADHGDILFQSGQVRITNTATEYIDNYGVLGYIRNLLGMMHDAKTTRLECEGWFEDKARSVALGTSDAAEKLRRRKIAGSRKQVLLLKPKFSLCRQQKMFIRGAEFEFLFHRSPTTMFLNGTDAEVAKHKIRIHSLPVPPAVKAGMEMESTNINITNWSVLSTLWFLDQHLIPSHWQGPGSFYQGFREKSLFL